MYTHLKFALAGSVTSSDSGHSTQTSGSTDVCMPPGASPPPPLHLRRHSVLQPPGSVFLLRTYLFILPLLFTLQLFLYIISGLSDWKPSYIFVKHTNDGIVDQLRADKTTTCLQHERCPNGSQTAPFR